MTLTPEQIESLCSAITPSVKIASTLELQLDTVETFQNNLKSFVCNNHSHFAGQPLGFVLSKTNHGTTPVTNVVISKALLKGHGVFLVDKDLLIIRTIKAPDSLTHFMIKLGQDGSYGVFVSGSYIIECLCGFPLDEFDAISGAKNLPFYSDISARPMSSFNLILDEHKRHRVDNQKGFFYWANKSERVLKSDGGTEWIFHNDLFWWLKHYLSDAVDVIADPSGCGQDKHDIRVVTEYGKYVIEIKWMGNNGATKFGQDKINVGLVQVAEYLNKNDLLCGHLVVYDGRSKTEHENNSSYDESFRHELCEIPRILFLESEAPSKKAERIVKESKKK